MIASLSVPKINHTTLVIIVEQKVIGIIFEKSFWDFFLIGKGDSWSSVLLGGPF